MSRRSMQVCALFALTAFIVLLLPLLIVIGGSFDGSGSAYLRFPPAELTLKWYRGLPATYIQAFGRSLIISTSAAVIAAAVGTITALSLARSSWRRGHFLEILFRLPLQIPFVVIGVAFMQFYYALLDNFDVHLLSTYTGLITAHVFFCLPYTVATVGAVITHSLSNIENAARIAGASEIRVLRRVTLPALMPGLFSGLFYAFIISFGDIPVSIFLAETRMQPLPVVIFQTLQFDFDPAVLSASTLVILFSVALIVVVRQVFGIDLVLRGAKT